MKVIGVTKCPVGIAHTYLAAEKLENAAKEFKYDVKIETQGAQGTENLLTEEDIAAADYVIIAADVAIEGKERFVGKKVLEISIKEVIKDTKAVLSSLEQKAVVCSMADVEGEKKPSEAAEKENTQNSLGKAMMKQLMNGVSYMIPFVVLGGLFIALSISFGGTPTSEGMVVNNPFWSKVNAIGSIGFNLMIPILAGFIAFSISGRAALAPAMISAVVANDKAILGTSSGTGFWGAILVGYLAGYLVKWMNTWKIPKNIRPIMPIFVIPLLGTGVLSAVLILFFGRPIAMLMTGLQSLLSMLSQKPETALALGLLLGAMVGFDMGGPINKVAFLFGTASIVSGTPQIMGAVAAAIPVAPLAVGLATLVKKDLFKKEEIVAGVPALLMGLIGISEGAIPFAASDPKRVIPSNVIGSAVAAAVSLLFGITDAVPHGGPIVGILGATNNVLLYFLSIMIGTVVTMCMILLLKKRQIKMQTID